MPKPFLDKILDSASPETLNQLARAVPFIQKFCRKYRTKLENIGFTSESEKRELAYFFSNNKGYFTI